MECEYCAKKFNGLTVLPQLMQPCNHTICLECLSSLNNSNCPICNQLIRNSSLNQTIIDELNTQARLNQSFERISSTFSDSSFDETASFTSSLDTSPLDNTLNEKIIRTIDDKFLSCDAKNSPPSLLKPGRVFILESVFIKECKKKPKVRYFFLFNDILVYGKKYLMNSSKLVSQHILSLNEMQVKPFMSNHSKYTNGMFIMTPKKSFSVYANTPRERTEWLNRMQQCISLLQIEDVITKEDSHKLAPLWTPDKNAPKCMRCYSKFSIFNRKHHCRMCGYVVCNDCSVYRLFISSISNDEPVRICEKCHDNHKSQLNAPKRSTNNKQDVYNSNIVLKHSIQI